MKKVFLRLHRLCAFILFLYSFMGGIVRAESLSAPGMPGLTHKLQRALVGLPGYSVFDYVTFRVADDRVVLIGDVLHPDLKQEAEQAIRAVPGVAAVENDIRILPQSQQDDAIRWRTYARLYRDPQFAAYAVQIVPPVHIIVRNGSVTLEGFVNNPSDRFIAESAVTEAVGASAVQDHLLAMGNDVGEISSLNMRW